MENLEGKVVYVAESIDKHMALEAIEVHDRNGPYYKYRLINLKTLQLTEKWESSIFLERDLRHTQTIIDKMINSKIND
jgi:hypothetical protein